MSKPDRKTFQERSNRLLAYVRSCLANGTYKIGDYLPSETALAQQFELSKNSARMVLEKLVEEGLIRKIPRVGTQVTALSEQTKIRFGLYSTLYEEAVLVEVLELFHQKHPDVHVEPVILPYSNPDSIKQLLQLGVIDVVSLNYVDYMHFREQKLLYLLESLPQQESAYPFLNELFAEGAEAIPVRPFIFSPVIMCYNKQHFLDANVFEPDSSWMWNDLRKALSQLAEPNQFGLCFQMSSMNRWPIFLLQSGVSFVKTEHGLLPAEQGLMDNLHMIHDLIHEEGIFPLVVSSGLHDGEIMFKQQKVSVILTTYFRLNELVDVDFPLEVAQLPRSKTADTLLLTTSIGVNAASRHKEIAILFSDFLLSDEVLALIRRRTFTLTANKRITESIRTDMTNGPPRLEIYREMIQSYAAHDRMGLTTREMLVFGESLEQYFSNLIDEEEMLKLFNEQLTIDASRAIVSLRE